MQLINTTAIIPKLFNRTSYGNTADILSPDPALGGLNKLTARIVEVGRNQIFVPTYTGGTRMVYTLEGGGGAIVFEGRSFATAKGGVLLQSYNEPIFRAGRDIPLTLLDIWVKGPPKDYAIPPREGVIASYAFNKNKLHALVSQGGTRERTFFANCGMEGLPNSPLLQFGEMIYAPNAFSPVHWHTNAEHFYFIQQGIGTALCWECGRQVSFDVGPGSMVVIPAGQHHQLISSPTGLVYYECQAYMDFVTTVVKGDQSADMNWYYKGSDGKATNRVWVQS